MLLIPIAIATATFAYLAITDILDGREEQRMLARLAANKR